MQEQQQQYPIVAVNPGPNGIVVTIARSPIETQTILIPIPNADSIAIQWLATRPPEVLEALKAEVKRQRAEQEDIRRAVKYPHLPPPTKELIH